MEESPKVKIITLIVVVSLLSVVAGYYFFLQSNSNRIRILDDGYFFGAKTENPNQTITYIYLRLSAPVREGDVVHIYKNESDFQYNLVTWKVNRTQDGKTNISIPLDMLDNLRGTMDMYIKRGNSYLYRGEISFSTHPKLDVSVTNISVRPVSVKYAYITGVHLLIKSQNPLYIWGLNFTVFNANIFKEDNSVIHGVKEVNISVKSSGKALQLVQKGTVPVKIALLYPTYPDHMAELEEYNVRTSCMVNFTYTPVTVTNFSVHYDFSSPTILRFQLSGVPDYPIHIVVYKINGTVIGKGWGIGIDKNNSISIDVRLPHDYNFNGTYIAVLEDDYGFVEDSFTFTLKSGPLLLISHKEEFNDTNEPNKEVLSSIVLKLKNMGNSEFRITEYEYNISFVSNGTVAAWGDYPWFSQSIPVGEFTNVTLPFHTCLITGADYKISIKFEGGNPNVSCMIEYEFKA